jgi:hypothetical protein
MSRPWPNRGCPAKEKKECKKTNVIGDKEFR